MLSVDIILNILEYVIFLGGDLCGTNNEKLNALDHNSFFLLKYILTFHKEVELKEKTLLKIISYLADGNHPDIAVSRLSPSKL